MTCWRTLATWPGAASRTFGQPCVCEPGVGGPAVLGAGEPLDQPALLQPADDVGEPGQGRVGLRGERRHPQRPSGASDNIASTKYSKAVSSASRRSCASSTPGSSSSTATNRTHAASSGVEPLRVHPLTESHNSCRYN